MLGEDVNGDFRAFETMLLSCIGIFEANAW
jgi:hypothetical protein